jgi:hypothetical protein
MPRITVAANPRDALCVVPAVQEPLYGRADPLEPEPPEALGEVSFIAGVQVGEVGAEKLLERTCAALAVGAGWRRIQGQGHLVCNMKWDRPELRAHCRCERAGRKSRALKPIGPSRAAKSGSLELQNRDSRREHARVGSAHAIRHKHLVEGAPIPGRPAGIGAHRRRRARCSAGVTETLSPTPYQEPVPPCQESRVVLPPSCSRAEKSPTSSS